jgi:hypothetical protein
MTWPAACGRKTAVQPPTAAADPCPFVHQGAQFYDATPLAAVATRLSS